MRWSSKAIRPYSNGRTAIETRTEIVVSPEHSVEIRRIAANNHSEHERVMEVTSYLNQSLTRQGDDTAHPALPTCSLRPSIYRSMKYWS